MVTYWPFPHNGGLSTYINMIKEQLEIKGHKVDVLASSPDQKKLYYIWGGKSPIKIKSLRPIIKRLMANNIDEKLSSLIKETEMERYSLEFTAASLDLNQYNVIHAQDVISARALARVKPLCIPLILTMHGSLPEEFIFAEKIKRNSLEWKYFNKIEQIGSLSSDRIIFPSNWLKNTMKFKLKIPENQSVTIQNSLDINSFYQKMDFEPSVKKPPNVRVIACIARLTSIKGHHILIKALAQLKDERKDWICWFIGDGELKLSLKQEISRLNLINHVEFLGNKNDIPALLKQVDIFVLPSFQENLPYAIIEAQLAGVPIICSDAGGLPEMVKDNENGLIFPQGKVDELYDKLKLLLGNKEFAHLLARRGVIQAQKKWSIKNNIKQIEQIYYSKPYKLYSYLDELGNNQPLNIGKIKNFIPKNNNLWKNIINNLPDEYSIPDLSIIKSIE